MLSLLILLVSLTLTLADIFSGNEADIRLDYVFIDSTTDTVTFDTTTKPQQVSHNVIPVYGTPNPPKEGTLFQGILYDRGTGCGGSAPKNYPRVPGKIAMLKLPGRVENGNGSCTHKRALQLVKEDGAVAAIVYSALAPGSSPSVPSTLGLDDQYPLTVYWIDTTSAAGLLAAVSSAALGNSTLKASKRYARAILYPTEKFFPGIWEFTLIIVVILLTLSFATSVAMHCHLYRVRRRQDANMAANAASRSQKTLLDKSVLDSFPVYTYSEKDKAAAEMAETSYIELNPADIALPPSVASSTSSLAIREEIIELQAESSQMAYKKSEEFVMKDEDGNLLLTEPATIDANSDILFTHAQLIIPTCAVCLEDFELGDQLRELPCGHRYHTECIDPWLTEKSSACPMCKADFHRPATATEEPTVRSRRQSWFRSEEDTFVNGPRSIFARYRLRRQRQRQQRRSEGNV